MSDEKTVRRYIERPLGGRLDLARGVLEPDYLDALYDFGIITGTERAAAFRARYRWSRDDAQRAVVAYFEAAREYGYEVIP